MASEQYLDDPEEARKFMDWGKSVRMTAITTHLNVRRLLRDLVESRLVAVEQRVGQLHALLERIEAKLDAVQQSRPR